jgi:murein DD-endopeptidase MepM/ murein hydrolase activator NlpD
VRQRVDPQRRSCAAAVAAVFALALLLPLPARAALPRAASVPGGVALVPLAAAAGAAVPPRAWLGEQPVLVTRRGGEWIAVVGLALDTQPGTHELRVQPPAEPTAAVPVAVADPAAATGRASFTVRAKDYPAQRITLKDSSKVDLSAEDLARVTSEIAEIRLLQRHWRAADDTDLDFILPAQGRMTGRFGLRRFFNGEARAPHAGFDIAAARGSPVRANAQGIVLASGDYFFNGRTVFVDHGNGLLSVYCHLERIDVRAGEVVAKGQRLGLVGMSGRATGPHLHWGVVLNGALVDPQLFVAARGDGR